jgi:hypothetical protein
MMMDLSLTSGVINGGVGRMLGAGGESGMTLPSRKVQRDQCSHPNEHKKVLHGFVPIDYIFEC